VIFRWRLVEKRFQLFATNPEFFGETHNPLMRPKFSRSCGPLVTLVALVFSPLVQAQTNGTWNVNASGNWSDTANWLGGNVASGASSIASFNTQNIVADQTATIDSAFTIGRLNVLDAATSSNQWIFAGSGVLTLDNGVSRPIFDVGNLLSSTTSRGATVTASLAGTNGFRKIGDGVLTVSGNNSGLSGTLDLDDVGGTNNAGVIFTSDAAVGGLTTMNVTGTATTGPFLGLNGVTLGSGVTLNISSQGGNSGPSGALRGGGGATVTNTVNGPINITGSGVRLANAGGKLLVLNGAITGGSNPVIFRVADNDGIHVTNTGNSWTGGTTHSQGNIWFHPNTLPGGPLVVAASGAGTVMLSGTMSRSLGIGAGQVRLGGAETSVSGRNLGFSAKGGPLTVNFGGAGAEVFFNDFVANTTGTAATINTNIFVLNGGLADDKITLANPLNLNGAPRTLQVSANVAELQGAINGGAFTVTKTGAGRLNLTAASGWTGGLTIAGGNNSSAGIVRVSHAEGLGPISAVKNVTASGTNRGVSVLELVGGITIDANKSMRMAGKSYYATDTAAIGDQVSLRNVSGNNAWHGNVIIAATGGGYGIEAVSGTLTLGDTSTTSSVIRNEAAADIRPMSFFGAGDVVVNSKLANNVGADTRRLGIIKIGSGDLSITRTDNDFDQAPNLRSGVTEIVSLADSGTASSLGTASAINLGATLRYVGSGGTSNRTLGILQTGATLDSSGSGPLVLTGTSITHQVGTGSTTAGGAPAGSTELLVSDPSGLAVGQTVTGTVIPAGTTITAINVDTRVITLSQPTSAASTNGIALTFGGANTLDRTLTLTGSNSGDNELAANLTTTGGTGKLGVTKTGTGKWILSGTNHTYTGVTDIQQGTLGFDGGLPIGGLTMSPTATLDLANVTLSADALTGNALSVDGNLVVSGPVRVDISADNPIGTFPVLEYGSIAGLANLTSNYRNASFNDAGTSASMTVATGESLTWTGSSSDVWDVDTTQNWKDGADNPETFFWADSVVFNDEGSLEPSVFLSGEMRPSTMTVDSDTVDYLFDGPGRLAGAFKLTKNGTASLTLNGNHTFDGGIDLNEGTLRPVTNQSLGGNGQVITIASGAALDTNGAMNANRDYAAVIAGTGADGTGVIVNSGATHNNGFGSITLTANATIGGVGRWDLRPAVAGTAELDLAGFTLTKAGTNVIALVDGSMTSDGSINLNEGVLAMSRMIVSGAGSFNVGTGAILRFENNSTGSYNKAVSVADGGAVNVIGNSVSLPAPVTLSGESNFDIANSFTLTLAGEVGGTGNLVKSTATGALTLLGANTYAGTTTIGAGTLNIGNQTSPGTLGEGDVVNNGTLGINRSDDTYVVDQVISGTGALAIGQNNGGAFTSLVTLTGENTFAGNISVNSGGLKITRAEAIGTGPKTIGLTNGTAGRPQFYLDGSSGNIDLPVGVNFSTSSGNIGQPAIGNLAGDNIIRGNFTLTGGGGSTAIGVQGGTLELAGNIAANTSSRRLILGGDAGSGAVSGVISNGTNPVGLDKVGTNTWNLTGANSYTGTTAVNGGTLLVNGNQSTASGAVSVASGATLGGGGTIGGSVSGSAGSFLAPGNSNIGILTTSGPATVSGTLEIEINATDSDRLAVGGSLTLSGATLDVSELAAAGQPAYIIASYGLLTGTFGSVVGIPSGYGLDYNYLGNNQIALVAGAASPFGSWIDSFAEITDPADKEPGVDFDGDGVSNLLEFALNGDPADGSNSGLTAKLIQDATAPAGDQLTLIIAARRGASFAPAVNGVSTATIDGVVYTVQGSLDLVFPAEDVTHVGASDTAPAATGLPSLVGEDWEYHTFSLDSSEGLGGTGFLRLAVEED
jgi:autotransporter-associated beta strand protein